MAALARAERQRRFGLQQLGEADDGVERRAQLVRHLGQELRLGAVGALGLVARCHQRLLGFLARRDVEAEAVAVAPAVGLQRPGHVGDLQVHAGAAGLRRVVALDAIAVVGQRAVDLVPGQAEALLAQHLAHRHADQFGRRAPHLRREALVDEGVAKLAVDGRDEAREGFEQRALLGLAVAQGALGALLDGHVARDEHDAAQAGGVIAVGVVARLQHAAGQRRRVHRRAHRARLLQLDALGQCALSFLGQLAGQHVARAPADRLLGRDAGAARPGRVDDAVALVLVDHGNGIGHRVDGQLVGAQRALGGLPRAQVGPQADRAGALSGSVEQRRGVVVAQQPAAVGALEPRLVGPELAQLTRLQGRVQHRQVLGHEELACRLTQHLVARAPEQAAHRVVEVHRAAVGVDEPVALRGGAHQLRQQVVLVGELAPCLIGVRGAGGLDQPRLHDAAQRVGTAARGQQHDEHDRRQRQGEPEVVVGADAEPLRRQAQQHRRAEQQRRRLVVGARHQRAADHRDQHDQQRAGAARRQAAADGERQGGPRQAVQQERQPIAQQPTRRVLDLAAMPHRDGHAHGERRGQAQQPGQHEPGSGGRPQHEGDDRAGAGRCAGGARRRPLVQAQPRVAQCGIESGRGDGHVGDPRTHRVDHGWDVDPATIGAGRAGDADGSVNLPHGRRAALSAPAPA